MKREHVVEFLANLGIENFINQGKYVAVETGCCAIVKGYGGFAVSFVFDQDDNFVLLEIDE